MTDKSHIRVPVTWSVAITIIGAAITWGSTRAQLETVTEDAKQVAQDVREGDRRIATHDTQIAVIQAQLSTIQAQLNTIIDKLERAERRRQ